MTVDRIPAAGAPRRALLWAALGGSLPVACGTESPGLVRRRFDARGVERVLLRASGAEEAVLRPAAEGEAVIVTGRSTGGAEGYHPADPKWRETPAAEWGLDFAAQRFGATLVISTMNEISYIHHHYALDGIEIRLPAPVQLVRQRRRLTGDGAADLSSPLRGDPR